MSTAKELGIKVGDTAKLTDDSTRAIMGGFGGFLGLPTKSMIGRDWMCHERDDDVYKFAPVDDNGKPFYGFEWVFTADEDAFQPRAKKTARS
jgi:hypothetical protein